MVDGPWIARARLADLSLAGHVAFTNATLIENYNAASMFQISGPVSDLAEGLDPSRGVVVWDDTGEQRFCGFATSIERTTEGATITYTGDLVKLWWRICWPTPASAWTSQNVDAYDNRTASAETRALQYINFNAGPGAQTARRTPRLRVLTSGNRGPSAKTSARFDIVGELAANLAELAGLRMRITQVFEVGGAYLDVDMVEAPDQSAWARFGTARDSGPGLLSDYRYKVEIPPFTVGLAAAGGEGTARLMRVGDRAVNPEFIPWGNPRIERFIDQRGTTEEAQVDEAIDSEFANNPGVTELAASVGASSLVVGSQIPLGAKVAATVDGLRIVERIRQIQTEISVESDQPTVRPTAVFGSPDAVTLPVTTRQLQRMLRTAQNSERI